MFLWLRKGWEFDQGEEMERKTDPKQERDLQGSKERKEKRDVFLLLFRDHL